MVEPSGFLSLAEDAGGAVSFFLGIRKLAKGFTNDDWPDWAVVLTLEDLLDLLLGSLLFFAVKVDLAVVGFVGSGFVKSSNDFPSFLAMILLATSKIPPGSPSTKIIAHQTNNHSQASKTNLWVFWTNFLLSDHHQLAFADHLQCFGCPQYWLRQKTLLVLLSVGLIEKK